MVDASRAISLKIGTAVVSALRDNFEIRLPQGLAIARRPIRHAHLEVTIGDKVSTSEERLSFVSHGIAHAGVIIGVAVDALEVCDMDAVDSPFGRILIDIGVFGRRLALLNDGDGLPLSSPCLALHLHHLVVLAIAVIPRDGGLSVVDGDLEIGDIVLPRRSGHELIVTIVAHPRIHARIVFAGRCQRAVAQIELGAIGLAVPIVIAFDVVP